VIILYEVETLKFSKVDYIPSLYTPGQLRWHPDNKSIVGVVWQNDPYPWLYPISMNKVNGRLQEELLRTT
jgi:hypothetical protein